jgi:hypothetical protein
MIANSVQVHPFSYPFRIPFKFTASVFRSFRWVLVSMILLSCSKAGRAAFLSSTLCRPRFAIKRTLSAYNHNPGSFDNLRNESRIVPSVPWDDDESFGAYDYEPDDYELEELRQQELRQQAMSFKKQSTKARRTEPARIPIMPLIKNPSTGRIPAFPPSRPAIGRNIPQPPFIRVVEQPITTVRTATTTKETPTSAISAKSQTAPAVRVAAKAVPSARATNEAAPGVRATNEAAPAVRVTKATTPAVRVTKDAAPVVSATKATAPVVSATKDAAPDVSAIQQPPPTQELPTSNSDVQSDAVSDMDAFLARASSGTGGMTTLDHMMLDLDELEERIYQENNGNKFNINSPTQVGVVIFGPTGGSTGKDVLEAKAASGLVMADLILKYRALKRDINKLEKNKELANKGTKVKSATKVARETHEIASDPLILVDASAYIYRAYYSMPIIHRSDGMPTGATMGFCKMLDKLFQNDMLAGRKPRVVLVFDSPGKSFRSDLYPEYKAQRQAAPDDLVPQFNLARAAAKAYGIAAIEAVSFEADDVIATLAMMAQREGIDVHIFSGDKDLAQLITEKAMVPSVHMIDPATMARTTYDEVVEKWGTTPSKLGDLLALSGDSADNIPGIPGAFNPTYYWQLRFKN